MENVYKFMYEGWGEQAERDNEKSGDLIIIIHTEPHSMFERKGLDLHYKTSITLKESIIGKKITIPYFQDIFDINTKELGIINPSKEYIIFQKGLENNIGNKGSMYVKFDIQYPTNKILNDNEILKIKNIFLETNIV